MRRREFLRISSVSLLASRFATVGAGQLQSSFDVCEKSIQQLQAALALGETSSERLVDAYLSRIAAYDQAGPRLNAVLHVNSNARAAARELDEERRLRGARGPLHGIPVLIKDNFETRDMPTTGGCLALRGVVPAQDAFQVRKLRLAGAVLLGKVNLHELALGLTTVSSLGGQTLNPYDLTRAPGGSSGGSGVAASACFAGFAMGTDTSGSIRIPSSHNALVGLRPSAGLSSRAGIIPFGHTQDTGGPMARSVEDVALILDATVGYDPADVTTIASGGRIPRTYTAALKQGALKGTRIGMLTEFFGETADDSEVAAIVRRAIDEMKTLGAAVVEVTIPNLSSLVTAANLLTQELKAYLGEYLGNAHGHALSIEELLESGLHAAGIQGILDVANATPVDYLSGDDYRQRLAARETLANAVLRTMEQSRVDAIVYPTIRRIAPVVGAAQPGSNAALSANSGLPAITVPAGFTPGGFPVGVELLGRRFGEFTLLGLAFDYQQATRHRRPPSTTPSLSADVAPANTVALPSDTARFVGGGITFQVAAKGTETVPPSNVPFQAVARFHFDERTGQLGYAINLSGSQNEAAGVYLHRRVARQNGGVAYVLSHAAAPQITGQVRLTEAEITDFKAGKFYLSILSKSSPRLGARANIVLPS